MNYSNGKNVFFALGLFLLLFVSSCKNEEDHSPCGRPDCFVIATTHSENGVVRSTSTQTYTTVAGQKLFEETSWTILSANTTIKAKNEYDSKGRLVTYYTTNIVNGGSNTSKVTSEYDTSDRLNKQTFYGNSNNIIGYALNTYEGNQTKPNRTNFYNLQDEMTAHKEFEYDANNNLTQELDYQMSNLYSRTTYSDYDSEGQWSVHFYEVLKNNPDVAIIDNRKVTHTFEDCNIKSSSTEEDGVLICTDVNTIENGLIISSERFDATGNTTTSITTYEYDCN